jgi:uncharacterized protein YtpQ (UPF0354 family)
MAIRARRRMREALKRSTIAGVILLAVCAASGGACRFFHKDDLAERVQRRFQEVAPQVQVTVVDANTLRIKHRDGTEGTVSLDNLRVTCEQRPEACETTLRNHVAGALRVNAPAPPSREQVRAVLKDDVYVAHVQQKIAEGPPDKAAENKVVARRFLADLWIVYVLDQPESMQLISHGVMKKLGLHEAGLHDLALANLRASLQGMPSFLAEGTDGIHVVQVGDSYEASRLLLPELWQPLQAEMGGDLLACAPTRDVVYYTSALPPDRLRAMRKLAQSIYDKGPYSLSTAVFKWTPKGWVLFER